MPTTATILLHVDPGDIHAQDISTLGHDLVNLSFSADASGLGVNLLGSLAVLEQAHAVIGAQIELVRFRRQLKAEKAAAKGVCAPVFEVDEDGTPVPATTAVTG